MDRTPSTQGNPKKPYPRFERLAGMFLTLVGGCVALMAALEVTTIQGLSLGIILVALTILPMDGNDISTIILGIVGFVAVIGVATAIGYTHQSGYLLMYLPITALMYIMRYTLRK